MSAERDPLDAVETLVGETRAVRLAVHDLIARMHDDRCLWEREIFTLLRRPRLTFGQRQRLCDMRLRARRRQARVLELAPDV